MHSYGAFSVPLLGLQHLLGTIIGVRGSKQKPPEVFLRGKKFKIEKELLVNFLEGPEEDAAQ